MSAPVEVSEGRKDFEEMFLAGGGGEISNS